jgi:hypothetical protein
MATLFVDKIDPQSGTSLEIGSSGDTITIPSGATITNNGTQTGFGGTNTPSFLAFPSGNQSIPNNSSTKLTYTSEQVDNGSAYDATNSKFVAPSAGLYFFNFAFRLNGFEDQEYGHAFIYLNGSNYIRGGDNFQASGGHAYYTSNSWILNLSTNDYVEAYLYHNEGGSNDTEANYGSFSGFKLIT